MKSQQQFILHLKYLKRFFALIKKFSFKTEKVKRELKVTMGSLGVSKILRKYALTPETPLIPLDTHKKYVGIHRFRRHYLILVYLLCFLAIPLFSQNDGGRISGNLQTNAKFFLRDSLIGAANTPQYDRQLFGADTWLNLNYSNWGFDFGIRFDVFNNSNLLNPTGSYSDEGIGRWFIRKKIQKLGISVGYLYDQIGSGIIFRAYEERPLLIDNALYGLRLEYDITEDWRVKAFTGRQKQQFDVYKPIIKGASIEGFIAQKGEQPKWSMAPGIGLMNRTLDDATMDALVATINTYQPRDTFTPTYNVYAATLYNTLTVGPVSWYFEGAYKSEEAIRDPFGEFIQESDTLVGEKFIGRSGTVFYTSLSYVQKGFGATLEAKRTENFSLRTRPQESLNQGMLNYLPALTRINTYRLASRYFAATQELGELAFQADVQFSIERKWNFHFNASNITDLSNELLYRELYMDVSYKHERTLTLTAGLQHQNYNQAIFEVKPGAPNVKTITPLAEVLYKVDRRKALRLELQYMLTGRDPSSDLKQDYGDWLFALLEYSVAPRWTLSISDMFNANPGLNAPVDAFGQKEKVHFPRIDIAYTNRSNRYGLSYVKQVEGVVCTGGICRLEPAFSGFQLNITSSF